MQVSEICDPPLPLAPKGLWEPSRTPHLQNLLVGTWSLSVVTSLERPPPELFFFNFFPELTVRGLFLKDQPHLYNQNFRMSSLKKTPLYCKSYVFLGFAGCHNRWTPHQLAVELEKWVYIFIKKDL